MGTHKLIIGLYGCLVIKTVSVSDEMFTFMIQYYGAFSGRIAGFVFPGGATGQGGSDLVLSILLLSFFYPHFGIWGCGG